MSFPLFPRTLLWRTFITFAITMVLALGAWLQIFRYFQEPARARDLAQMVASVVNLTRTALLNADPTRRADLLFELLMQEGIRIYPAEPTDATDPLPDTRLMHLLTLALREQLGENVMLASRWKTIDGFWVSFHLTPGDSDYYWVMLPSERIQHANVFVWLLWSAGALLVALLGAMLSVSYISSSLTRLTLIARMIGQGETPPEVPEDGPHEIATLAHAFNQMANNLRRTEADRTLILAGVSHDLRTPLARLRLGVEMSGAPEEDVTAMVADIESMDLIIGQFLDFGRGKSQEPCKLTDAVELIRNITDPYRLRGSLIALHLPERCELPLRPLLFTRALANLIDNALRYAGPKSLIDISLHVLPTEALLTVADRGPGIPETETGRMLQPFTRMEEARSNTRGAGLGLAIIDHIARAHNGRIELLPREGGGLRAVLHLSRKMPRASAAAKSKAAAPAKAGKTKTASVPAKVGAQTDKTA